MSPGSLPRRSFIQLIRYHFKSSSDARQIVWVDVVKDEAAGTREVIGVRRL